MPESYENKYRANESFSVQSQCCACGQSRKQYAFITSAAHMALGPLACHRENAVWCQIGGRSISTTRTSVLQGVTFFQRDRTVKLTDHSLQAWLPSSVLRGVLVADRWSIRAGHRLLPAAVWTLIFPTDRCPGLSHRVRSAGFDTRVGFARSAASSAVNRRCREVRSVISNPLSRHMPRRTPTCVYLSCPPY